MKRITLLVFPILMLVSCNDSDKPTSEPKSYFISLGDEKEETDLAMQVNSSSDAIQDLTKFEIGSASLEIFGFYSQFKLNPESTVGSSFGAIVTLSKSVEGEVTIIDVDQKSENSIGDDYNILGDFNTKDGQTGSFSVCLFDMLSPQVN